MDNLSCAVTHDTAQHLAGGGDYYGDRADSLAHDVALDSELLAEVMERSAALRCEIARIALASVPDRFGAVVSAIKEHAGAELDRMLAADDEAAANDEAEARAA